MSSANPFDLPEGYGGVVAANGGSVRAAVPDAAPEGAPSGIGVIGAADASPATVTDQPGPFHPPSPDAGWRRWNRRLIAKRAALTFAALFVLLVAWLAITAPISRTLEPLAPPQVTLLASNGTPIARKGAIIDKPVDVTQLPEHVVQAFTAVEDRRFYSHWGIDPRGMMRAAWTNLRAGGTVQGGSTITQQLAKITYLSADQSYGRKLREVPIAWWLEAWLSKDEILSRYLSNTYFGDNVYGLRAASLHYFYRQPERLTLTQAAMLAGLVKAPSRYAPTRNLAGAQAREQVVLQAMVAAGHLTPAEARRVPPATVDHRARRDVPSGTYFADWAMPQARATLEPGYGETRVTTTLDARLQDIARRVTARAPLGGAQVALVAMRPNGEVVAMVGGRNYARSAFNRATQARRQPGSTFKLFVYLAALRSGMTPASLIDGSAIEEGEYRPSNSGGRYQDQISLRDAFAQSSNVAAVRLYQQLGSEAVASAARDLGITAPIPANASVALGSSGVTLLELTAAYAAVAGNYGPVVPHAIKAEEPGFFARMFDGKSSLGGRIHGWLLDMLKTVVDRGTGRAAGLAIPAYGKTGTTQDSRDALFVGFTEDLVVGVWIGNDDNSPLRGASGGGLPARIWKDFMVQAIPRAAPRVAPKPRPAPILPPEIMDVLPDDIGDPRLRIDPETGLGVDTRFGDVDISVGRNGVTVRPVDPGAPDGPEPPAEAEGEPPPGR